MSWDVYPDKTAGSARFVAWNMALFDQAPDRSRPVKITATVTLQTAGEDGLPSAEERERLVAFRDELADIACDATDGRFALRFTSGGTQELVFYTPKYLGIFRKRDAVRLFERALADTLEEHPGWTVAVSNELDDEWTAFEAAIPSPDPVQFFMDLNTLNERITSSGDDPGVARAVTYAAHVPEAARATLEAAAETEGFSVGDAGDGIEEGMVAVQLRAEADNLHIHTIHPLGLRVMALAEAHDGYYGGWDAPIVPQPSATQESP